MILALMSAADARNAVGIVAYQGAGRAPELTSSMVSALGREVETRGFAPALLPEQQRAATMCGEDAECLATLGRRANVGWVLAIGLGTAGKQTLFSALLVEVETGKVQSRSSLQAATSSFDVATMARDAVKTLFEGVTPKVALVPVEPPPLPKPEPVVIVAPPAPPSHPLRPAAIGTTIGAGALAIGGGVLTVVAQQHYAGLAQTAAADRAQADAAQRGLNVAADVTVGAAIAAGVTAAVLFIIDANRTSP